VTVAFRTLNEQLRDEAQRLIADQIPLPEIRRRTNLRNSTIRWVAYRAGLSLFTNSGPTTHVPTWRGGPRVKSEPPPVVVVQVSSLNYTAAAAALRW
jgi:hypothetical protein